MFVQSTKRTIKDATRYTTTPGVTSIDRCSIGVARFGFLMVVKAPPMLQLFVTGGILLNARGYWRAFESTLLMMILIMMMVLGIKHPQIF